MGMSADNALRLLSEVNTTSERASPLAVSKCLRMCNIEEVPLKYAVKITVHESNI